MAWPACVSAADRHPSSLLHHSAPCHLTLRVQGSLVLRTHGSLALKSQGSLVLRVQGSTGSVVGALDADAV
eukprot:1628517-Rhodomonas_salina.2